MREACRQRVAWGLAGHCSDDLMISVNLSPHQFAEPTLLADVAGILADTKLPRGCDSAQGFLLSRPVPAQDVPAVLAGAQVPAPRKSAKVTVD